LLKFIGNSSSIEPQKGEPQIPDMLIENGIMYLLSSYLESDNYEVIKSAAWIYSNILACINKEKCDGYIGQFIQSGPVHKICMLTVESNEVGIKNETLWTVCNVINCGSV